MIEDKITKAQIVKDDAIIDKYNVETATGDIKTLLAALGGYIKGLILHRRNYS